MRAFVRGRSDDPAWVRPALLTLLGATTVLYLWGLDASGWANAYYSAATQAAASSWKAFFFGSTDASNFITVDKSPLFLWPTALAARIFGVNSWSILVPQALEGVATAGVLYLAVRRWFGPAAGLLAGTVMALTPVAALMFRYNNPDALLVLLMTIGAYAIVRAVEAGATRWVVLAGVCVGLGFLAKMLQALLVLPGFGLVYLVAAPVALSTRVRQLILCGVAAIVSAGWWIAIVELWPASSRPYIGGSQDNSVLELVFGYNGFGRLTGDETGSVGGGPAGTTGRWGATGLGRLFNNDYGGQVSWLLPAALLVLVGLLAVTVRAPRTDRVRAGALLWGGWLVVTGLAISLGRGIIHSYYTVALTPAIGALLGIGVVQLWRHRSQLTARIAAAVLVAVTAWWAHELFGRTPDWHPELQKAVIIGGVVAAVGIVIFGGDRPLLAAPMAALMLAVVLLGPAAYTGATVATAHSGALPSAGPSGGFGLFGGGRLGRPPGGTANGAPPTGFPRLPTNANGGAGAATGGLLPPGLGSGGRGIGGILNASEPSDAVVALLTEDADQYDWVAAAVSANQAAGYQLATGEPVMAIGGFNGSDPAPSLEQFQAYVEAGRIHYFIGGGGTFGGIGGGNNAITAWVQETFTSTTVDGTTFYDLTASTT